MLEVTLKSQCKHDIVPSPHGLINLSNEELLKVILYRHEQLSFDANAKILKATLSVLNKLGNESLFANSPLSINSLVFVYDYGMIKIVFVLPKQDLVSYIHMVYLVVLRPSVFYVNCQGIVMIFLFLLVSSL